jgi:hypothetical protein
MKTVPLPPLPLSQQILAWVLQALGLDTREVSRSTRRSALSGKPILRRWEDLVVAFLGSLGGTKDGRESVAQGLARHWDEAVGELPTVDLTMAERLHVPLALALPQLGIRLGVLACVVAANTQRRVSDCLWVTRPFDDNYFGSVFIALCRHTFKDATDLELAEKFDKKLDWRTVERWRSGATALPNNSNIAAGEAILGSACGPALRAARLAAALGASLSEWVGTATRDDFAEATATVAHRTAESLCVPEYLTSLLDGLAGDLRGPAGAVLVEVVRPWLPLERNDATAAEVANFVAESSAAPGNTLSWLFPLLLAAPTPRLVESIGALVGAQGLSMVAAADPVQLVKHAWLARAVTKAVAGASAEPLRRGDGAVIELEPALRELAKRCLEQPLRFHRSTDDVNEGDVLAAVYAATGGTLEIAALNDAMAGLALKGREASLDDAAVAASATLSLARATRLAEHGDLDAAMTWFRTAGQRGAFQRLNTLLRAGDAVAAIGHATLDACRPMRAVVRAAPAEGGDRQRNEAELRGTAIALERLVTTVLPMDGDDALVWTEPDLFVPIAGLLFRLATLREETAPGDQVLATLSLLLRTKADRLLARHIAHGRLWAIRTLAETNAGEYKRLAKQAVHFGGGDFLATASSRIDADLGLTQDAG